MKRRYVDISELGSRNMMEDGNIDFRYWFNKTIEERLKAASVMIATAFNEPEFLQKKVDRILFSSRKHLHS